MSSDSELERLLREARGTLAEPDAESSRRARAGALAAIRGRRARRLRIAAFGLALIVAVGLGVTLGTVMASRGVAAAGPVGRGFLPETGWNVLQTGQQAAPDQQTLAVAANVAFHPEDAARGIRESSGLPYSTLLQLPPQGVVVVASFRVRVFQPWYDASYPARTLPLQMSDAVPHIEFGTQVRPDKPLGQYQLRATVSGYYVNLEVYFGTARPSPAMIAAAQRQIDRLVVASDRVTIFARPAVSDWAESVTLFGSVDSGAAGESVSIQARECGFRFFGAFAEATTREGGGWSIQTAIANTTTLRAVWKGSESTQVTVRKRLGVNLDKQGSRFLVGVNARRSFWRKKALIQRREGGAWQTVKSVILAESRRAGLMSGAWATFTLSVPRRTLIRAVLPRSQTKPCYLPGVSRALRT